MTDKIKGWDQFLNESENTPTDIKTVNDVEKFILGLAKTGKLFHFDDSASTIIKSGGSKLFKREEAAKIEAAMDQSFEVCEKEFGKQGLWEGFVKGVFIGYIAFGASKADDGNVYIVKGNGGPGKIKITTLADYKDMESKFMDPSIDDDAENNENDINKWFDSLKKA